MSRTLLLVTGSGRSGTSTMAGTLHHLGVHVPGPHLDANESNPRGFYESRWSVEFHNRLLKRANVGSSDGRPEALSLVADAVRDRERDSLAGWLEESTEGHALSAVKDPRATWALGLWSEVAAARDVDLRFVTMLRHPAEVVGSRATHYAAGTRALGERGFAVKNLAGWVNAALVTERQTRGRARGFVRYDDLLSDWRTVTAGLAHDLDVDLGAAPTSAAPHPVDSFIDPMLSRHRLAWEDVDVPTALAELAQQVWEACSGLADSHGEDPKEERRLDRAQEAYTRLYRDAQQLAHDFTAARVNEAERATRRAERKKASAVTPTAAPAMTSLARAMATRLRRRS
ncbi:MAG: sulfotransferase family protein [Nocardioidaceae bacterium]